MGVEIVAEDNDTSIVDFRDVNDIVRSRVGAAGAFITAVNAAPSDSHLAVGECAWWYDVTNNRIKFKARKNSTDYYSGEIQLTIIP